MPGSRSRVLIVSQRAGLAEYTSQRTRSFATIGAMPMLRRTVVVAMLAAALLASGCGSDVAQQAHAQARRLPVAEPAHRRAMRRARSAGGSRQARRTHDQDLRGGAAGQHGESQGRSAGHPRRRTGPGRLAARAVRGASHRAAPHPRRRADRPARHGTLVAVDMRGLQAARRRCVRYRSASARARLPGRIEASRRGRRAVHDGGVDRRPRSDARSAGLPTLEPLGRQLRNARRARVSAPVSRPRAHDDARRRGAARHGDHARRMADARGGARPRSSRPARRSRNAGRRTRTSQLRSRRSARRWGPRAATSTSSIRARANRGASA